jgi:hypothetical protein
MHIAELYDLFLDEKINIDLNGELLFDNDLIKWEYDGLGKNENEMSEHLKDIYELDKETIEDFLRSIGIENTFQINEPNFDESYVFFHLIEN